MRLFLLFIVIKKLTLSQIILYTLFKLPESNQFKHIFIMNYGRKVWLYLWFNRTVQRAFTEMRSLCSYLLCFWQQNHNIFSELPWTYELIYCGLPEDLMWVICILSISQGSFGYSFFHTVYSECQVRLFENVHFRKIHFLTQQDENGIFRQ